MLGLTENYILLHFQCLMHWGNSQPLQQMANCTGPAVLIFVGTLMQITVTTITLTWNQEYSWKIVNSMGNTAE